MERTEKEIRELIAAALEYVHKGGSKYPGMSYEEGVVAALDWITGETDDYPME